MKITIKTGVDGQGKNYRTILCTNSHGNMVNACYKLSREITGSTSEVENGVFYEYSGAKVSFGDQQLILEQIHSNMSDEERAQVMIRRIRATREWIKTFPVEKSVTVSG